MTKRISLKYKILSITTTIFVGVLCIVVVVIIPSLNYINNIKHEIELTESQLEEQYQKIRLLKKSINELDTIRGETQKFNSITISQGEELDVIQELEALAPKHNIQQNLGVVYQNNIYTFSFQAAGDYHDLINYIYDIETLPYYINISAMNWFTNEDNVSVRFNGDLHST